MRKVDVIIVGSGFAGSILAMILRRLGRSVVLLEKGKHPRFAIGESSTPLTNLLLEEIATKYSLPDLATFSKWGTWQAAHPKIACGLKRGFTFYQNEWDEPVNFEDRARQLLVAASPNDRIADTHWYRPDFDAHMARQATELGAELHEQSKFELREEKDSWLVKGESNQGPLEIEGAFLIDASGPRGCLFRHFGEPSETPPLKTEGLFAHFENVARLDPRLADPPPYPVDDAAVHHIFDGGWIWVLRFNNGITSAGVSAVESVAQAFRLNSGEPGWKQLLARLPTLNAQFANARAITPFIHQSPLSFRVKDGTATGPNWAMLPSAMGFVDPLFSTGFVLTLLGVSRLAELFSANQVNAEKLRDYETQSLREFDLAAALVDAAFRNFHEFERFAAVARIYFAAAIWAESLRRLGKATPSFLLAGSDFEKKARKVFSAEVPSAAFIEPYDLAGLLDPSRGNWHPALAADLYANSWKIPATPEEIEAMLRKCGFGS